MDPSKLLEWLKLNPTPLFAIVLATTLFLFLPGQIAETLGITELRTEYRLWLGLAWLGSLSILSAQGLSAAVQTTRKRLEWRRNLKRLEQSLHNLAPPEKTFLRGYIDNDTRTQKADIMDGVVNGLVAGKVVFRSASVGYGTRFSFNIQPWAWDYLKAHPELLADAPPPDMGRHSRL